MSVPAQGSNWNVWQPSWRTDQSSDLCGKTATIYWIQLPSTLFVNCLAEKPVSVLTTTAYSEPLPDLDTSLLNLNQKKRTFKLMF
jgi:hypothetical protein